jgi:hypothetical protein
MVSFFETIIALARPGEIALGLLFIYVGLVKFSSADQLKGLFFGLLAIAGLILTVHGLLLFLVPDFFKVAV